jgi:hypothetical protein
MTNSNLLMYTVNSHQTLSNLHTQERCVTHKFNILVSLISSVIMILLFLSEFTSYREIKTMSEMFIDVNRGGEKVKFI